MLITNSLKKACSRSAIKTFKNMWSKSTNTPSLFRWYHSLRLTLNEIHLLYLIILPYGCFDEMICMFTWWNSQIWLLQVSIIPYLKLRWVHILWHYLNEIRFKLQPVNAIVNSKGSGVGEGGKTAYHLLFSWPDNS